MGMGRREVERQGTFWVATGDAAQGPRHVFYEKLNALLAEAVSVLLSGDLATGKSLLRHYVNATIGFTELSRQVGTPAKSLMRMLSQKGNPTARNLFTVIGRLQVATDVHLSVGTGQDAA